MLRRDLADLVVRPGTCFAQSGTLHDPYRGETIAFVRGPTTSDAVQIDHVVSLADAWYKGARDWDDQRRRDFANDPRNLLAVSGKGNFDKAFRDAASWLPPNVGSAASSSRERRGEDRLRAVGVGQGEARHDRRARRLLARSVAPKRAPFRRNRRPCRQRDR